MDLKVETGWEMPSQREAGIIVGSIDGCSRNLWRSQSHLKVRKDIENE